MGRGRQRRAFVITMIGAAILVALALTAGIRQIAQHGPAFFVFRAGGTGETAGNETDQQFLAHGRAASPRVPGRHSTKSASAQ